MQVTRTQATYGVECIECPDALRNVGTYAKASDALRAARIHRDEHADHYPTVVTR